VFQGWRDWKLSGAELLSFRPAKSEVCFSFECLEFLSPDVYAWFPIKVNVLYRSPDLCSRDDQRHGTQPDFQSLSLGAQIYDPFRILYSVWLDIRAILKTKLETQLLHVAWEAVNKRSTSNQTEAVRTNENVSGPEAEEMDIDHNDADDTSPLHLEELMDLWKKDPTLLNNLPLKLLCPACFGSNPRPQSATISFDGNFQQRRFNRHEPFEITRDNRMFIECSPDNPVLKVRQN
jgi:hypothetical protein